MTLKTYLWATALTLTCGAAVAAPTIMTDTFASPASGWNDNGSDASKSKGFSTYTPSGKYQMTPTHDNTFGISLAPQQAASGDVRVEADLFMYAGLGGGAAGAVCRYRDHDNFYAFVVSGAPGWAIVRVHEGRATTLAKGSLAAGPVAGAVDTRVVAECAGTTLRLKIGKREASAVDDAVLSGGRSGLVVIGEQAAGTSAVFDNFVLTGR